MLIYSSNIIFFSQCTDVQEEIKAWFDLRARPGGAGDESERSVPRFAVAQVYSPLRSGISFGWAFGLLADCSPGTLGVMSSPGT